MYKTGAKESNNVFPYPREAGVLVGGSNKYVVMEAHFDNPTEAETTDMNGIRVYYTNTRRQYVAGSLQTGDPFVSRSGIIVSGVPYQHSCPSECTSRFSEPINIFSVLLHMHRTGRSISENVYHPNGTFKENLSHVNFWSDNFQQTKRLPVSTTLNPGESLQLTCVYDTSKTKNTAWGVETSNEMCMGFHLYYPIQVDPVTTHDINICGWLQYGTLCVDGARVNEIQNDTVIAFNAFVRNPSLYDAVGAQTDFSIPDPTCAPVPPPGFPPLPTQSTNPVEEPSPSVEPSEMDPFVTSA